MAALKSIVIPSRVKITDVALRVSVYAEPSAAGGIRAHVITRSSTSRGPEVWIDAPELRKLRDLLNEVLGD